jgi:L,D-transpeptidase catalytic domain
VRVRPADDSPEVGILREGATVTVTACLPDCGAPHAWALLGADGALKLEMLNPQAVRIGGSTEPTPESLWYGRVGKSGIKIFKQPRANGPILTRKRLSREMAFLPEVELRQSGWFERVEGGYVRAGHIEVLTPSLFHGEARPNLPLAFVVRKINAKAIVQPDDLHRYDRVAVRAIDSAHVATDRGLLPRSALRIVTLHSPPPSIPAGAKWVLVDLSEQTMTAYEGETAVFATLISSGKVHEETQTYAGLYQVEHKMVYSDMHGEPDDPYDVDRVPYTLYFHKSEGLHGTYWHDHFGTRESHGCVNLSLADARWLFDWAPPRLPEGWSTIDPRAAGLTSLWVRVERKATLNQVPRIAQAALH